MFNPDNYFQNEKNVFGKIVSLNMLCVHRDEDIADASIADLREIDGPHSTWQG